MDSQVTLVDPQNLTALLFSSSGLENTDVFLSSDTRDILFTVRSPEPGSVLHVFTRRGDSIVATLKERLILSDTITFVEEGTRQSKIKVDKWLKKAMSPDKQ